jgi:hypothetical protein
MSSAGLIWAWVLTHEIELSSFHDCTALKRFRRFVALPM